MPAHGGLPVTFCPLLVVNLGLSGFGISHAVLPLKRSEKCPGRGGWAWTGREDLVLRVDPSVSSER